MPRTETSGASSRRARAWLRAHSSFSAALVYAVLSLAMFSPALVPGRTLSASDMLWNAAPWQASAPSGIRPLGSNREQVDSVQVFQPFLQTTRSTLPDVPLWNPYIMGGRPYLADAQSAVFSPLNWPGYLLPFWDSLAVMAALKLFLAAFGTCLLARALGMRFAGALLAGTVFGFSLWMVSWVTWPTTSVWAWLPWLCLLTDRLVRRPGPLPFVGLAVVVALQYFGGHPESWFHVLLFSALFWLARALDLHRRDWPALARSALGFGAAVVAGTALAAAALIPFLELLHHSVDVDVRNFLGPSHMERRYLFGAFLHDYWGRQTRTSLVFPSALEESAYYVGALTLMLCVAAVVLRPRIERLALGAVGLLALAIATGIPPIFDLVTELPGFSTAHNARLAVLAVFSAALLAGWGLDDLMSDRASPRRSGVVLAAAGALVVLPLVTMAAAGTLSLDQIGSALKIAWGFAQPPRFLSVPSGHLSPNFAQLRIPQPPAGLADLVRLASLLEWLVLAAAGFALLMLRLRSRIGASTFATLAVGLIVLDLFKAGVGYTPAIPTAHAKQPTTHAIRYLQSRRPNRFVGLDSTAPSALVFPIPPDVAMRYRLYDGRGYDYPVERRYLTLWQQYVAGAPGCLYAFCGQSVGSTPRALRALGVLGVADLLQDPRDKPLREEGLRTVYSGSDARVYRNPYALPRAFVVERQRVEPDDTRALASLMAPGFDRDSVAVTREALPGIAKGAPAEADSGSARIVDYDPERVTVRTATPRGGLLVLTDTWFPGWKATVDGRDAPVHRVDYLLRGISVPAGTHQVEFSYEPASWRAGWIISLSTLLILAAVALSRLRARPDPA
jgi:hypothetical protein